MCEINWEIVINALGIIVNAFLAWWIVSSIQKRQNNERAIKDHFTEELKDLRTNCRTFLTAIYQGNKMHREIIPTLKLIGIKASHLMNAFEYGFGMDKNYLNSYLVEMNKTITDDPNFISCSNPSECVTLTPDSLDKLLRFQSSHQNRFNDLVLGINEAKYRNLWN